MELSVRQHTMRFLWYVLYALVAVLFLIGLTFVFRTYSVRTELLINYVLPQLFAAVVCLYFYVQAKREVARAQQLAHKSEDTQDRYLQLYRSSPVPYLSVTAQGVIIMANLAALRFFGDRDKNIVSQSLIEKLNHDNDLKLSIIKEKILDGESFTDAEVLIKLNERESRWVMLSCFSYGKFEERFISLVDIDHHKRVDAAKTEFVTLASHQLRTPVSTIKWAVSLLEDSHADKSQTQRLYYEKITHNLDRLMRLIEDFLQVSKLELGTFSLEKSEVNLTHVLKTIVNEQEDRIRQKHLEVVTKFSENSCVFFSDHQLLHMIFSNLISNAIKYSREAGTVSVSYAYDINQVTVSVADDGVGIPEPEHANLFKKFYRASNVSKGKIAGNGLGLYIVKQAVDILGGHISFRSAEGKGTVFIITLPLNT